MFGAELIEVANGRGRAVAGQEHHVDAVKSAKEEIVGRFAPRGFDASQRAFLEPAES